MKNGKGFTLIEIMIVVAILGILASLAYPSYVEQVQESRRTDARTALFNIAQQQEEFFIQRFNYASNFQALYAAGAAIADVPSPENYYTVSIDACGDGDPDGDADTCQTYTLEAEAVAGTSQFNDKDCRKFIIDNLGVKTAEDSDGVAAADCW
jgi:type IV pilus assembly protein PilE